MFGQKADAVVRPRVPQRAGLRVPRPTGRAALPVGDGGPGDGRRQGIFAAEPGSGFGHRFDAQLARTAQRQKLFQLRLKTGADVLPQKVVLLPHLGVAHAAAVSAGQAGKIPADALRVPAVGAAGFQRVNAAQPRPGVLLKGKDRVRRQQPEHGHRQLTVRRLCGQILVFAAGVVDAVWEPAPQRKAVGAQLVAADGRAGHAVFFLRVGDGDRVQHPGTDGFGVIPKHRSKILHISVHQRPALVRVVAHAVGAVHPLVELVGLRLGERHPGPAAERLRDFPPGGDLVVFVGLAAQQLLVAGFHQRVVLEGVGGGQPVLLQQADLPGDGVEIRLQELAWLLVGHADKVVYIDDGVLFVCHGVPPGVAGSYAEPSVLLCP